MPPAPDSLRVLVVDDEEPARAAKTADCPSSSRLLNPSHSYLICTRSKPIDSRRVGFSAAPPYSGAKGTLRARELHSHIKKRH